MQKWFENDFTYLQLEIEDTLSENISIYFDRCFEFIESSSITLVHCI